MHLKFLSRAFSFGTVTLIVSACGGDVVEGQGDFRVDHAGTVNFPVEANEPRSCQDGQGRLHVVWYDARSGEDAIFYNRSANGGATWNIQDLQLNTPESGGYALVPDIACFGDRIYVVWEDHRDGELERATADSLGRLHSEIGVTVVPFPRLGVLGGFQGGPVKVTQQMASALRRRMLTEARKAGEQ